MQSYKL